MQFHLMRSGDLVAWQEETLFSVPESAGDITFNSITNRLLKKHDKENHDGYLQDRTYRGWFPSLFYESPLEGTFGSVDPSALLEPVVVDIHTDSADSICSGDPSGVLHRGVGGANFMLVAVKHANGSTCTYAGPVFSHYEFTEPIGNRLTDSQWKNRATEYDSDTGELVPVTVLPPNDWQSQYLAE